MSELSTFVEDRLRCGLGNSVLRDTGSDGFHAQIEAQSEDAVHVRIRQEMEGAHAQITIVVGSPLDHSTSDPQCEWTDKQGLLGLLKRVRLAGIAEFLKKKEEQDAAFARRMALEKSKPAITTEHFLSNLTETLHTIFGSSIYTVDEEKVRMGEYACRQFDYKDHLCILHMQRLSRDGVFQIRIVIHPDDDTDRSMIHLGSRRFNLTRIDPNNMMAYVQSRTLRKNVSDTEIADFVRTLKRDMDNDTDPAATA